MAPIDRLPAAWINRYIYFSFTYFIKCERIIKKFRDKKTEEFFNGKTVKQFSVFKKVAERKLTMLDSANEIRDLLAPPANRLEKLKGNRGGQYSIRINDQWRICFVWKEDGPYEVEITDYH